MRRVPDDLLLDMASSLPDHDRDEMAIPSYLHRNPAMRWMAWRRVEVVAHRLQRWRAALGRSADRVVDFGCGSGVLLAECRAAATDVVGIDLVLEPARMLIDTWGLRNVSLMTPGEADDRVAPASVDAIIAAEVLEHVDDPEETLTIFERWLRPKGLLLVSLPTENQVYRFGRRLAGFKGHYHHHNAKSIDRIIRNRMRRRHFETIPLPGPASIYWVCEYEAS